MRFFKDRLQRPSPANILVFAVPLILLLVILTFSISLEGAQQFSDLSQAFVHGHLNFLKPIGGLGFDPVFYHGKIYWSDGPFPSILLMPFVAFFDIFHGFFLQNYLQWILLIAVFCLVYKLARLFDYKVDDSLILALGFFLGSVFIGVAGVSSSWLFAQVITTLLLFWSMYEYFTKKRWWLIGAICGCILLTRITASPIIIFFALELWSERKTNSSKTMEWIKLGSPFVIAIALIGLYNFLRFHNPLDSGTTYQLLHTDSSESRALGIFSPIHIPSNLYSALLGSPLTVLRNSTSWTLKFPYIQNNSMGMSIFITSPYLLNLFTYKWSVFDKRCKHLLAAIGFSALGVLCFYGIGIDQFGYRYTLDFLPELFVLFMILYKKQHHKLSKGIKFLLLGSGVSNFYLLQSFLY